MDRQLFDKALEQCEDVKNAYKVSLNSWTREFFEKHNIPSDIYRFLEDYSFNKPIRFGHVYYDGNANEMMDNNLCEENSRCLAERLLIIGSGLNGDFIVLDLDTLHVGFALHDELWENEGVNPRDIFLDLKCTIGEFYYKAMMQKDFPVDGYEAAEYIK